MPYKPNYCCNCGGKVDRPTWNLLTSRMFCENCEQDFKKEEWTSSAILIGIALLASLFSLGSYLKSSDSTLPVSKRQNTTVVSNIPDKTRNIETVSNNPKNYTSALNPPPESDTKRQLSANRVGNEAQNSAQTNRSGYENKSDLQNAAGKNVFYCGAQTKKGTPCTRRVKTASARCWQHTGLPALAVK